MKRWLLVLAAAACATTGPRRQTFSIDDAAAGYPCVLHEPREWPESFMVRQTIEIHARRGDRTESGQLDAVMQKQGDTLLIVGLGPMNQRAFTLAQRGRTVEFTQNFGPELPFSPRYILVDVHRVFFKALPAGPDTRRGELDGEHVEERWKDGELETRSFSRPGSGLSGAVRIEYGAGCRAERCQPDKVTVHNEWFGYTLTITNHDYEALD